jgi:CHAT domain-containing protein
MDRAAADPLARTFALFLKVAAQRLQDAPQEAGTLEEEAFLAAQDLHVSPAGLAMAQTAARAAAKTDKLAILVRSQQDMAIRSRLLDARLMEAVGAGQAERAAALREELGQLGVDLKAADVQLGRSFPAYGRLISSGALSVEDLRKRLEAREGLLLIRPAEDDVHVFALSSAGLEWRHVTTVADAVASRVAMLRCEVDPLTCSGKESVSAVTFDPLETRPFDAAAAHGLYADLIKPVEAALKGVERLFVTVSGPLANLPLDMLVTEPVGQVANEDGFDQLRRTPWLGDRYAMISLPAVSALGSKSARRGHAKGSFLGYGAPATSTQAQQASLQQPAVLFSSAAPSDRARLASLEPLPGTEVELRAMAKVLGAPGRSVVLGPAATEAALRRDKRLGSVRVLAFATHGLLPEELNGHSEAALVFSQSGAPTSTDDGLLTASEASELSLAADWVILSACNTASSEGSSDSLSALARGFLYAGSRGLIASHWRVADDATAALTVETLAAAQRNPELGHAAARQKAIRAVRTGRRDDGTIVGGWSANWMHPAAWAPFTLIAASNGY